MHNVDESPEKNNPLDLEELRRAKPFRAHGAPERTHSHKENIASLLAERGNRGVLGSELYGEPAKFGRSPRNRISELRADGYLIEGRPHGSADWRYVLIRDNRGKTTSADWYTRQTGNPRPSSTVTNTLPLFAVVSTAGNL